MKAELPDIAERLDIVELIFNLVIKQESEEFSIVLDQFKVENVQWVLTQLSDPIEQLFDSLELEYEKAVDY
jgi:hypothetical protein